MTDFSPIGRLRLPTFQRAPQTRVCRAGGTSPYQGDAIPYESTPYGESWQTRVATLSRDGGEGGGGGRPADARLICDPQHSKNSQQFFKTKVFYE